MDEPRQATFAFGVILSGIIVVVVFVISGDNPKPNNLEGDTWGRCGVAR